MAKALKIGLFGFGCVGKSLFDIFQKTDFSAEVIKICVKDRNKKREVDASYITFEKDDILESNEINLVVELISDADEAYQIVKKALLSGKDVVTANKKMLALHLEELIKIQQDTGSSLLYEAAVCGSIPIIRTLAEYYDNELLHSVKGIFNGSTNYILTKIGEEQVSYDKALEEAQEKGFAEADPTLDVAGFDPTYKLCLTAAQAYGVVILPDEILRLGIHHLKKEDINLAKTRNAKIKLLANIERVGENQLSIWVLPKWVENANSLFHVDYENNAVLVEAAFSDKQTFIGKGAGGHPTASAVLSDISAMRYSYQYEYRKTKAQQQLEPTRNLVAKIYARSAESEDIKKLDFLEVEEETTNYIIGHVSLKSLYENRNWLEEKGVFVALIGEVIPSENFTNEEKAYVNA